MIIPMPKQEKPQETIDLSHMSDDDIRSLKTQDPFMYHSIPSVHKAMLSLEKVDHSEARTSQSPASPKSSIVSRKSRISTECHISVFMDEIMNGNEEEFSSMEDELELGLPIELFALLGRSLTSVSTSLRK